MKEYPRLPGAYRCSWLHDAERVFFIGFGYHPHNVRRLDLGSCQQANVLGSGFQLKGAEGSVVQRRFPRLNLAPPDENSRAFLQRWVDMITVPRA